MMPFVLYICWMLLSAWGCTRIATASFGPGDGVERLLLWMICLVLVGYLMLKAYPDKPRSTFRLNSVRLHYFGGMAAYTEVLDMDVDHNEFLIYDSTKVFYAILEDTDFSNMLQEGTLYLCKPVFVKSLKDVEVHSQTDLLKIEIDKDGMPKVEYIGPEALVRANCNWDVIPGAKK
jgi:hypothetical protein